MRPGTVPPQNRAREADRSDPLPKGVEPILLGALDMSFSILPDISCPIGIDERSVANAKFRGIWRL